MSEVVDMRILSLVLKVFLNYLLMENSSRYGKNLRKMDIMRHMVTPTRMNLSKLVKEVI